MLTSLRSSRRYRGSCRDATAHANARNARQYVASDFVFDRYSIARAIRLSDSFTPLSSSA